MPNEKLILWGMGGHSLVVADIVRAMGGLEIIGYIVGGAEQLESFNPNNKLILAFGDCDTRLRLGILARESGLVLATAIHPAATIAPDAEIGTGTVIAAGAVVNPGAKIGRDVIINTCASVDHECVVGDGAHICPGVHLAGRVRVGRGTQIGIGATVIEHISVGEGSLIGAGAVVVREIPDNAVAYGVPARVERMRNAA